MLVQQTNIFETTLPQPAKKRSCLFRQTSTHVMHEPRVFKTKISR